MNGNLGLEREKTMKWENRRRNVRGRLTDRGDKQDTLPPLPSSLPDPFRFIPLTWLNEDKIRVDIL